MRFRILTTALITTVGILMVIAGLALLLDPVLVAIVVGGMATIAAVLARGRRRPAPVRTEALVVAAAMITAAFVFLDGVADGTLLLALGFLVLLIGSWNFDRAESAYSAASSHQ